MHLTYYPHLPLLDTSQAIKVLRHLGLPTSLISQLTGYSSPIVWHWLKDSSNATEPARQRVSELAYRALLSYKLGLLPTAKPGKGERPDHQAIRQALAAKQVDLNLAQPEELIGLINHANP